MIEGQALIALGQIHLDSGNHPEAIDYAEEALSVVQITGQRLAEARALRVLGSARQGMGDLDAARAWWAQALAIFTDVGAPEADELRGLLASYS